MYLQMILQKMLLCSISKEISRQKEKVQKVVKIGRSRIGGHKLCYL